MPAPWAVGEFYKVYGRRPAPALTHAPAAPPLPKPAEKPTPPVHPARAEAQRLRREFPRTPAVVREIRAAVAEYRRVIAEARAVVGDLGDFLWAKRVQRATAFGGVVHAVVSSGQPTSKHDVLEADGCRVPPGLIPVWREHDAAHVIGLARVLRDNRQVYAEIVLRDNVRGRAAAADCRSGALWACSAGYAALTTERRFYGLGERISEWHVSEISLTAKPRDFRCRAVPTTSPVYREVTRAIGFPLTTKEKRR